MTYIVTARMTCPNGSCDWDTPTEFVNDVDGFDRIIVAPEISESAARQHLQTVHPVLWSVMKPLPPVPPVGTHMRKLAGRMRQRLTQPSTGGFRV